MDNKGSITQAEQKESRGPSELLRAFFAVAISAVTLAAPFLYPALYPLTWISFVPLLWILRSYNQWLKVFLLVWLAGAIAHLLGFYWVDYTIKVFGGFPHGISEAIFLLFAAYASLSFALWSLLVRMCGLGPLCVFPGLFWVAIEFSFPQLFPWHLANSQADFLVFIQAADLVGPYGTSFLLVWFNALLYAVLFERSGGARTIALGAAVLGILLIANLLYGHFRLKAVAAEMEASQKLDVAAVQGSIAIRYKWVVAHLVNNLRSYLELTKKTPGARLYLWPESAVEGWLPDETEQLSLEVVPALPEGGSLIFGVRSYQGNLASPAVKAFNSAFLIDAEGRVLGRYHKQVLLAFGEYLPFSAVLSKIPKLRRRIGSGFSPGNGPSALDLAGGIKIGPLICYEDLMPELARRLVSEKGANLLVNLTNDVWFGETHAPWQHARLAQWRAIETRRALVRVTTTGVTTVINPRGELVETLPPFSPGVLTAKVEIMDGETFYVRFGDWFAWTIVGASAAIVLGFCFHARRARQLSAGS